MQKKKKYMRCHQNQPVINYDSNKALFCSRFKMKYYIKTYTKIFEIINIRYLNKYTCSFTNKKKNI